MTTTVLTVVPDSITSSVKLCDRLSNEQNLLIDKVAILIIMFVFSLIANRIYYALRSKMVLNGRNYTIQVEYGDLLNCKNCQRVIAFDECFTSKVGNAPNEIKPTSICGQYLMANQDLDIQKIVNDANLQPDEEKSRYNNKTKYTSGLVAPNGENLLLAFAKLDESGRGFFPTRKDYLDSLSVMWSEIHKYYQSKDVCISVLGGGQTTIGEATPTQQELVDLIIGSYKLSAQKIKKPQKLRIICRKKDDISLNKIGEEI